MPERVVLVSPSGQALKTIHSLLADVSAAASAGRDADVTIVGWDLFDAPDDVNAVSLLSRVGAPIGDAISRLLDRTLRKSFIGLNLIRLSPWDTGRVFWRGVRRNSAARNTLLAADIVVALERDALLTVWKIGRRSPRHPAAVTGMPAALDRLSAAQSANPVDGKR